MDKNKLIKWGGCLVAAVVALFIMGGIRMNLEELTVYGIVVFLLYFVAFFLILHPVILRKIKSGSYALIAALGFSALLGVLAISPLMALAEYDDSVFAVCVIASLVWNYIVFYFLAKRFDKSSDSGSEDR